MQQQLLQQQQQLLLTQARSQEMLATPHLQARSQEMLASPHRPLALGADALYQQYGPPGRRSALYQRDLDVRSMANFTSLKSGPQIQVSEIEIKIKYVVPCSTGLAKHLLMICKASAISFVLVKLL